MKNTMFAGFLLFFLVACGRHTTFTTNQPVLSSETSPVKPFDDFKSCSSEVLGEILYLDHSPYIDLRDFYRCEDANCRISEIGDMLAKSFRMYNHPEADILPNEYKYCSDINCRIQIMSKIVDRMYTNSLYTNESTQSSIGYLRACKTIECKYEKIGDVITFNYLSEISDSSEAFIAKKYFNCK
jgi:hypothetical protein